LRAADATGASVLTARPLLAGIVLTARVAPLADAVLIATEGRRR
jgi:hypothetical protein